MLSAYRVYALVAQHLAANLLAGLDVPSVLSTYGATQTTIVLPAELTQNTHLLAELPH
jgi:hypothetical protein